MTAPIPLAAPDGTVYAWRCSTCGVVATSGGEPMFMPTAEDLAEDARRSQERAESCCVCVECGGANPRGSSWLLTCAACAAKKAPPEPGSADWSDIFCHCGTRLDDAVLCDWCMRKCARGFEVVAAVVIAATLADWADAACVHWSLFNNARGTSRSDRLQGNEHVETIRAALLGYASVEAMREAERNG